MKLLQLHWVEQGFGTWGDLPRIEEFVRERARERGFAPDVIDRVWTVLAGFGIATALRSVQQR